jgi:nucleotide-binding universal stress UspA family protein
MMNAFKITKVIVPYDFSRQATNALDTALAIGQQHGAAIVILNVVDNSKSFFLRGRQTFVAPIQELARIANESLNMLVKTLTPKHSFPIGYAVEVGIPAFQICRFAWENDSDMIVLGRRADGGIGRFFSESIHYKIIKNSPCPVLSVPSERLFTKFGKIIFPVRAAPLMLEKYDFVRPFVQQNDSSIIVAGLTGVNDEDTYKRVSRLVDAVTGKLRLEGVPFTSRINFCSSISGQLLEISKHENADMIVITSVTGSYLRSFFLEYYAKMIVGKARCPVLSIRPDMISSN